MKRETKLNLFGQTLLLFATIAWGTSFTILQDTIETVPKYFVLGVRFFSAAVAFFIIFFKRIIKMNIKTFAAGAVLGAVLSVAYVTQTIGLKYTSPGKNAFLTSLYCVMVPFMVWAINKKKPRIQNVVALILCMVGVAFISMSGDSGQSSGFFGEAMTLVCAVFYALQIVFIDRYTERKHDSIQLLFVQFLVTGVLILLMSLIFEVPDKTNSFAFNKDQIWKIAYLTVVCTLLAQAALVFGQKMTRPEQASVILTLESVFGALFSIIWGRERVTLFLILGFAVIFISVLISEVNFPIGQRRKKKEENSEEKI